VLCSLLWVTLLQQEVGLGWAGWPTEVPSNPGHAGILWFCERSCWATATWRFP